MIKISKTQFYLILVLILLLPLSSSWKLLLFGKFTKGEVVSHSNRKVNSGEGYGGSYEKASVIRYYVGEYYYEFSGVGEIVYPVGKKITIIYNPKKPEKFLMFNFAGLFLSQKMIIPGVMLIIWVSFYLTIIQNQPKRSTRARLEEYKHRLRIRSR